MERFDWLEFGQPKPEVPMATPEVFDARHYMLKAQKAFRNGAYEAALRLYAKAIKEDQSLAQAWCGQVLCLLELGEPHEARTWASKALERLPENPELLCAKALVLAMAGELEEAATLSERAINKRDPSAFVWLLRGRALLYAKPAGNSAYCFQKALEQGGDDGSVALRVGIAYLQHGDFGKAKKLLDQAVQADPENPLAWYMLARCFEGLFAATRAASCYERCLVLQPEFRSSVVERLNMLSRRGALESLLDLFRERRVHGA